MDYAAVADMLSPNGWLQPPAAVAPARRAGARMAPQWDIREGVASSKHGIPGDWNESHPYRRATRGTDGPFEVGVGQFQNSEDAESLYAGLVGRRGPFWGEVGAATGYSGAPVVPFGRVGVDLNDWMRLFVAPAMNVDTGAIGPVAGMDMDFLRF